MRCIKREDGVWCPNDATPTGLCLEHLPGAQRKFQRKKETQDAR